MKPTISIFEDEIVITTDSFDLILKTGASGKASGVREDPEPLTQEEMNWKFDPFMPSVNNLEQAIDDYKEQHTEQFAPVVETAKTTDKRKKYPEWQPNVEPVTTGKITKLTREHPAKPCIVCGNDFKPTWNTQLYCPACKPTLRQALRTKKKPLAEQSAEELEKTLQDIENRRKKPYEFK